MTEYEKVKEKILSIDAVVKKNKAENNEKINGIKSRIRAAETARNEAESPDDYIHASNKIEEAENELKFYELKNSKLSKSPFNDAEYKKISSTIGAEKNRITAAARAELNQELKSIILRINAYKAQIKDIEDTKNLLMKVNGTQTTRTIQDPLTALMLDENNKKSTEPLALTIQYLRGILF